MAQDNLEMKIDVIDLWFNEKTEIGYILCILGGQLILLEKDFND